MAGDQAIRMALFGPPGVGKGTQAVLVENAEGIAHISTGDALRKAVADGTEVGLKAKAYMDRGELVPDDVVIAIALDSIGREGRSGFILDGFPRTVAQADALDKALAELGTPLALVVNLQAPEDELVRRLSGRRVCARCGVNYHIESKPPAVPGKCDQCGGDVIQREDDRPEAIRNRLRVYEEKTAPVISYYAGNSVLRNVDASGAADMVFERVEAVLKTVNGQSVR
ncbi:MAG: adenylate kinase [Armatimonadota bacterium]|nr:adenylate kinase [Armatimonadota bacterium]